MQRWIETTPQPLAAIQVPLIDWTFDDDASVAPWKSKNAKTRLRRVEGATGSVLLIESTAPAFSAIRHTQLVADPIFRIEVELDGPFDGTVALAWSHPGESLTRERSVPGVVLPPSSAPDSGRSVAASPKRTIASESPTSSWRCRFDPHDHLAWTGAIERIAFQFASRTPRPVRIRSIRSRQLSREPAAVAEALAGRAFLVDLGDGDVRSALVGCPEQVAAVTVDVTPATRLELGYGLQHDAPAPVTMSIDVRPEDSDATPVTLHEARLDPGVAGSDDTWHDIALDLGARFAGRRVTVELRTTVDGDHYDPAEAVAAWAHPAILAGGDRPPPLNVVLISVDTLRADHLSLYGYERPTSPFIDTWAVNRGAVFETVIAPSPWTLPSHVSMLTGLDALHHGENFGTSASPALTTLPELLRAAGYSTHAVTGGGFLDAAYGLAQGFDTYRAWHGASEDEIAAGVDRGIALLRRCADRPFFLFLHTYEVHSPYRAREPWFSRFLPDAGPEARARLLDIEDVQPEAAGGFTLLSRLVRRRSDGTTSTEPLTAEETEELVARYDSGIAAMDTELHRFLAELEALDLAERTVVVLTSDHGEALGEHGLYGHSHLYDFNLRVPLVVAAPGLNVGGRRIDGQVRTIDIVPTILDLVDVEPPADMDGESLARRLVLGEGDRTDARHRDAWSYAPLHNTGVAVRVEDAIKFITNDAAWPALHLREELYRLDEDPAESNDVAASDPRTEQLRAWVRERLESAAFDGVTIDLRAADGQPLDVALKVVRITAHGFRQDYESMHWLKSLAPLPADVQYRQRGERVTVSVPEGRSLGLRLPCVKGARLVIEASVERPGEEPSGFRRTIRLDGEAGRDTRVFDDGVWRTAKDPTEWEHLTGVRVTSVSLGIDPGEHDAALLRQLEALGYVR